MKRSRFRSTALLAAALLLAQAGAQAAAPSCDAPEELLQVLVSRTDRGTHVVRVARAADGAVSVLLPAAVLRPAEQPLVAATLDCGGEPHVVLGPEARVGYDSAAQQVRVSLTPARLGSHSVDFQGRAAPPQASDPVTPAWSVAFGAQAAARYTLGQPDFLEEWSGAMYADIGTSRQGLSGSVGALVFRGPEGVAVQPRATLRWAPGPDTVLYGAWNALLSDTSPGFGPSTFRGVGIAGRGGLARTLPEVQLELPLTTDVEVRLGGRLLRAFQADPGTLRLLNLPLPPGATTLTLVLTDETGTREVEQAIPAQDTALPPGAFLYSAQAGWVDGGWGLDAAGQLGLANRWTLLGQARLTQGRSALEVRADRSGPVWTLGASAALTGPGVGSGLTALQPELGLRASRALGRVTVQGNVTVPLRAPGDAAFGVSSQYSARDWLLVASASTRLRAQTWQLGASATRTLGTRGNVTVTGRAQPGGWQAGVRVGWTPAPQWSASAGTDAALQADVQVRYTPDVAHTAELRVSRDDVQLDYAHRQQVRAAARVGGRAAAAQVEGALILNAGAVTLQPESSARAVLVRTGIPGMRLLVGGEIAAVTDARGDALITRLPLGELLTVRVDLASLPLGVAVRSPQRDIVPPLNGVTTVDWRDNFEASRWVQYFWNPGEVAAYGEVRLGDARVLLDDEGYGLTPVLEGPQVAQLRSEDGRRTCAVTVDPRQDTARCQ